MGGSERAAGGTVAQCDPLKTKSKPFLEGKTRTRRVSGRPHWACRNWLGGETTFMLWAWPQSLGSEVITGGDTRSLSDRHVQNDLRSAAACPLCLPTEFSRKNLERAMGSTTGRSRVVGIVLYPIHFAPTLLSSTRRERRRSQRRTAQAWRLAGSPYRIHSRHSATARRPGLQRGYCRALDQDPAWRIAVGLERNDDLERVGSAVSFELSNGIPRKRDRKIPFWGGQG
jgi:hypothetical protein